jgi:hypothetical protein
MRYSLLLAVGAGGLLACHQARPVATATPLIRTRADSLRYRIRAEHSAYLAVLALTPGQPIQRLAPDGASPAPQLQSGPNMLTVPALRSLVRTDQAVLVPRNGTPTGYLDELGGSIRSPASLWVSWEAHPAATTTPIRPVTLVLVLLPAPVTGEALDQALPATAAGSPAATIRALQQGLGLTHRLSWLVLDGQSRNAI